MSAIGIGPCTVGAAVNWARNGVCPPADGMRALADSLHNLACKRPRLVSTKSLPAALAYYDAADHVIGRWAGRTGPLTTEMTLWIQYAPSRGTSQDAIPQVWVSSETLLTGAGTVVARPTFSSGGGDYGATAVSPDRLRMAAQKFAVSPDTDYRWTLHVINGFRVTGWTMVESVRSFVDPPTNDPLAIDTGAIARGLRVYDPTVLATLTLADKIHRRGGKSLFTWTEETAVTRVTASAANLLDQTIAAWSSTSPGFGSDTENMGTLAGATTVPCIFYAHGGISAGGGGSYVYLVRDGATLATLEPDAVDGWWAASFDLRGGSDEKIDVLIEGDGTHTLSVDACGAFTYTA